MRWDALFADMEAQLEAARTADLAVEVAELTRAERATVTLDARLREARGSVLSVRVDGVEPITGVLVEAAAQWLLLADQGRSALVPLAAVSAIRDLGVHSAGAAGVVERRLTLGHALRALARDRVVVRVRTPAGELTGRVERVGADHLDLAAEHGGPGGASGPGRGRELWAVPFGAVRVVRSR